LSADAQQSGPQRAGRRDFGGGGGLHRKSPIWFQGELPIEGR
jgi:hypothetical protein